MRVLILLALAGCAAANLPYMPLDVSSRIMEAGGVLGTSNAAVDPFKCTDAKLKACEYQFNQNIGTDSVLDWKFPAALAYYISKLLNSGTQGLVDVCNARQQFQQCLGAAYYSCLDPLYYLKHGSDYNNAYTYIGIFQSLEFSCVGGFAEGSENWPCIVNTMQKYQKTLDDCVGAWNTTVYGDLSKYCSAGKTLTQCYMKPFVDNCNYNGESGWWACNDVSYAFLLEHCHIPCAVPHTGGSTTQSPIRRI